MDQSPEQLDFTGGFSNGTLLIISLTGFTVLFALLAFLCHMSPADAHHDDDENDQINYDKLLQEADVSTLNRAQRRARAKLLMKKNRRLVVPDSQARPEEGQGGVHERQQGGNDVQQPMMILDREENDNGDGGDDVLEPNVVLIKPSRKERQKAAKELERAERKANESQRKFQMLYEEEQRRTKEKLMKEAKERVELVRQEKSERDFIEWRYMFPPSEPEKGGDGFGVSVKEFLQDLQSNQSLCLSETADRFSVSIEQLIRRIQKLEDDGRILHGIVNRENDSYFLVTTDCFRRVKDLIDTKGSALLREVAREVKNSSA